MNAPAAVHDLVASSSNRLHLSSHHIWTFTKHDALSLHLCLVKLQQLAALDGLIGSSIDMSNLMPFTLRLIVRSPVIMLRRLCDMNAGLIH